jgi:hypothetical protein
MTVVPVHDIFDFMLRNDEVFDLFFTQMKPPSDYQGTPGCGVASLTLDASPTGIASANVGVGCAATQHLQSSTDRPEDSTK